MKKQALSIIAILSIVTIPASAPVFGQQSRGTPSSTSDEAATSNADFILAGIDDRAVSEFKKAWLVVGAGADKKESVVLLFRKSDGSLMARSLPLTHEHQKFKFNWNRAAIGVVHTHPNADSPKPQDEDIRLADRFEVPVFTITSRGMFMYDPVTKKIRRVQAGLDWLEASNWGSNSRLASNN